MPLYFVYFDADINRDNQTRYHWICLKMGDIWLNRAVVMVMHRLLVCG
jgi:hypothetical protein